MIYKIGFVSISGCFKPEFAEPLVNLSVAVGRDATFRCLVHHLGGYRVSQNTFCTYVNKIPFLLKSYFLDMQLITFVFLPKQKASEYFTSYDGIFAKDYVFFEEPVGSTPPIY